MHEQVYAERHDAPAPVTCESLAALADEVCREAEGEGCAPPVRCSVTEFDVFVHPKTKRRARTYRVEYRRAGAGPAAGGGAAPGAPVVSRDRAKQLHELLRAKVAAIEGVEVR